MPRLTDAEIVEARNVLAYTPTNRIAHSDHLIRLVMLARTLLPRLLEEVAALRERELERKRHYHVAKYIGETLSDACGYCGKDLRDPIHRRVDAARKSPEGWGQ